MERYLVDVTEGREHDHIIVANRIPPITIEKGDYVEVTAPHAHATGITVPLPTDYSDIGREVGGWTVVKTVGIRYRKLQDYEPEISISS